MSGALNSEYSTAYNEGFRNFTKNQVKQKGIPPLVDYLAEENGERIRLLSGRWKSHKEDTVDWNEQYRAEEWRQGWEVI